MGLFNRKKPTASNYCEGCEGYSGTLDPRGCSKCRTLGSPWIRCMGCSQIVRTDNIAYCPPCKEILTMTPDDLYKQGYEDGKAGKAMNASQLTDPNYGMGYEDGKGDRLIERPVEDEYTSFNDAPEGFEYTKAKRVPIPYEFYLSKGGSATFLTRERKNNQQRHILRCAVCSDTDARRCPHHSIKGRG